MKNVLIVGVILGMVSICQAEDRTEPSKGYSPKFAYLLDLTDAELMGTSKIYTTETKQDRTEVEKVVQKREEIPSEVKEQMENLKKEMEIRKGEKQ